VSAIDGRKGPNEDAVYADEIARTYLDLNEIREVGFAVGRGLVWPPSLKKFQVYEFDAGIYRRVRVYVSTVLGKVIFLERFDDATKGQQVRFPGKLVNDGIQEGDHAQRV